MKKPVLLIYSGGMDSYTLLHYLRAQGNHVQALSFDYGQKHKKELEYAIEECDRLRMPHDIVKLGSLTQHLTGSALTDKSVAMPEGHYAADNMKLTVVPGRNTIMLSIAMGIAQARGCSHVYFGAHAGDHHIYPDCRPQYFNDLQCVFDTATEHAVVLGAPFLYKTKTEILTIGLALGLDYGRSWTCYQGGEHPCGKCGACVERAEAFEQNQAADPLL